MQVNHKSTLPAGSAKDNGGKSSTCTDTSDEEALSLLPQGKKTMGVNGKEKWPATLVIFKIGEHIVV